MLDTEGGAFIFSCVVTAVAENKERFPHIFTYWSDGPLYSKSADHQNCRKEKHTQHRDTQVFVICLCNLCTFQQLPALGHFTLCKWSVQEPYFN